MSDEHLSIKQKRIISIISISLLVALTVFIFIFVGNPLIKFVSQPDMFREWVDGHGIWGRIAFVAMIILQVICAIIPGEPFEIVSGYAFGFIEGTILCLLGTIIGGVAVFLFVRKIGIKAVEAFYPVEKIQEMKFLRDSNRLPFLTFLIYIIPGTPKDLITYFVGLTKISFYDWLIISSLARIPSIITSTIGGAAIGEKNYIGAIITFIITGIISAIGLLIYKKIKDKK